MANSIVARETSEVAIKVDNHKRNLSNTTVYAYAFPRYENKPKIEAGKTTGTKAGNEFLINIDMDFDPGEYEFEIWTDNRIVFPKDDSRLILTLINAKSND